MMHIKLCARGGTEGKTRGKEPDNSFCSLYLRGITFRVPVLTSLVSQTPASLTHTNNDTKKTDTNLHEMSLFPTF